MAVPVRPSDFEAIVNKSGDPIGTKLINTFVRLPILWYRLLKYVFDGPNISPAFDADLCGITCEESEGT